MWTASYIALLLVSCATRVVTGSNELSGGADGRGWGGANAAAVHSGDHGAASQSSWLASTVRTWVRGTIVQWRFDERFSSRHIGGQFGT